jgi:hypothetical protein
MCFVILHFTDYWPSRSCSVLDSNVLLTYYTEQSPSWETNRLSASQEFPLVSWNPKVHFRIYKCQPPVLILSQLDPVRTPTSHFLKIHLNVILKLAPGSPQWSLSLKFPHQNSVHTFPLPHTRHMSRLSHSSWCYHLHNYLSTLYYYVLMATKIFEM